MERDFYTEHPKNLEIGHKFSFYSRNRMIYLDSQGSTWCILLFDSLLHRLQLFSATIHEREQKYLEVWSERGHNLKRPSLVHL